MVRKCSMYSVRINGQFLNVPFVAVNDEQAKDIVMKAYRQSDVPLEDDLEFDIVKIGSFDVLDGVVGCEHEVIQIMSGFVSEDFDDEVPSSV